MQLCSNFTSLWSKYLSNNVWRDFRLRTSALATAAGESFNSNVFFFFFFFFFLQNSKFYITIFDGDIVSLKSIHTLFDKYLDYMMVKFEQNRMVQTIQNFDLFDKKWLSFFDKVFTPIYKTFLWLKR